MADALQAKLSPTEANTLSTAPTRDPEAYDLFLKGEYEEREAESAITAEAFDRAAGFYQQALERDPEFALAAARLAVSRVLRHWFVVRLGKSELAEIRRLTATTPRPWHRIFPMHTSHSVISITTASGSTMTR